VDGAQGSSMCVDRSRFNPGAGVRSTVCVAARREAEQQTDHRRTKDGRQTNPRMDCIDASLVEPNCSAGEEEHDDVVQDLEPFGALDDVHDDIHDHDDDGGGKNNNMNLVDGDDTSAMIAEATAAAIASATTTVDVMAVDAAALAAESAASLVDATLPLHNR
jgi:hypothetical protein